MSSPLTWVIEWQVAIASKIKVYGSIFNSLYLADSFHQSVLG